MVSKPTPPVKPGTGKIHRRPRRSGASSDAALKSKKQKQQITVAVLLAIFLAVLMLNRRSPAPDALDAPIGRVHPHSATPVGLRPVAPNANAGAMVLDPPATATRLPSAPPITNATDGSVPVAPPIHRTDATSAIRALRPATAAARNLPAESINVTAISRDHTADQARDMSNDSRQVLLEFIDLPRIPVDTIAEIDPFGETKIVPLAEAESGQVTAIYQSAGDSAAILGRRIIKPGQTTPDGQRVIDIRRGGITVE